MPSSLPAQTRVLDRPANAPLDLLSRKAYPPQRVLGSLSGQDDSTALRPAVARRSEMMS